ncbi:MAG TPA: asparagine synthase (glutamine-hydrolyzing) [Chloroflexota bacterium]
MCGIAGIVRPDGQPVRRAELEPLAAAIEHRGPDEGGFLELAGVGLAIRRLKIIDLVTGSQPIANEDESVWAVLNGEIYNFQSLRAELRAKGHQFRTQSDTECLVHAYEEYGDACVQRLRGMFAFAIWDARSKRLLLARDRVGKKPLVYAQAGGSLVFASELQALLQAPAIPREVDLGALGDYLAYGYVPAPATILEGVYKLPPGSILTWQQGALRIERYWQPQYLPKLRLDAAEAEAELERQLTEAVRLRLVSDVPLGALLSGGVDSSLIVALMARLSSGKVKTFSIGFEDAGFDELEHARRVAQMYDTEHHELVVRADAAAVLPKLVRHYGEPYADSSAVPSYYVCQMARQHVTVALNGDGGDELCAGYDRYRAMWLAEALRGAPLVAGIAPAIAEVLPRLPVPRRLSIRSVRFLQALQQPTAERYATWVSTIRSEAALELLDPGIRSEVNSRRTCAVEAAFEAHPDLPLLGRLLATDMATYLPNDLLVKMDIASMANSLEARSPLLDHEVVDFAGLLPENLKLRHGLQQKYLLKRLAGKLIPAANINRPKMGFGVPIASWLRGPLHDLAAGALFHDSAGVSDLLDRVAVGRLWAEHQAGVRDHASMLWRVLMLELWQREFLPVRAAAAVTA